MSGIPDTRCDTGLTDRDDEPLASDELGRLRAAIERAADSPEQLRAVFGELRDRLGVDRASRLWWDVHGALDATHT